MSEPRRPDAGDAPPTEAEREAAARLARALDAGAPLDPDAAEILGLWAEARGEVALPEAAWSRIAASPEARALSAAAPPLAPAERPTPRFTRRTAALGLLLAAAAALALVTLSRVTPSSAPLAAPAAEVRALGRALAARGASPPERLAALAPLASAERRRAVDALTAAARPAPVTPRTPHLALEVHRAP